MVALSECISSEIKVDGNTARQIHVPSQDVEIAYRQGAHRAILTDGRRIPLRRDRRGVDPNEPVLRAPAEKVSDPAAGFVADDLTWMTKPVPQQPAQVIESLLDCFSFLEADEDTGRPGLWAPQIGAIHSVLGYWTTRNDDAATVVMPTGTGKTEAMVGIFAAHRPGRVLVVVPSDPLRTQIGEKFEQLGVLQRAGVVDPKAHRPVVGRLTHRFTSVDNAKEFAEACNVIVTTPNSLLTPNAPEITQALLNSCTHLFVDEAHHVPARTWAQIRDAFEGKPVVQFTATPFREDGKALGGRHLYRYPLSVAQEEGFFAEIDYHLVVDLLDQDGALVEPAVARLKADLEAGLNHLLMARTRSVPRAEKILQLYEERVPELNPVVVHSGMAKRDVRTAIEALRAGRSRVVVCVDMLGEGFDMPELKVAAIHDPHKSLGVTLQFVGRFARIAGENIGKASVFVGRPDLDFNHGLRRLFAEDADWNKVISDLSESRTVIEEDVSEFEAGFGSDPEHVPLRSIAPKMSTVVYKTTCDDWDPMKILDLFPEEDLLSVPSR